MRLTRYGELTVLQFEILAEVPNLVSIVSTRQGGVSNGPCQSLNLSFRADDDPEAVRANRERLCRSLSVPAIDLVAAQQVHSHHVAQVDAADRGRGAFSWDSGLPATDALITNQTDLPLAVMVADCAPVALYDPVQHAVGLAHAGWRGAVGRVAARTALAMGDAFGSRPVDLRVGIGPCIGPCCFEVGPEVTETLRQTFSYGDELLSSGPAGRPHLDLPECLRRQMVEVGVPSRQIEVPGLCTACHTDLFYSHRAERGRTGRFAGLVMLRPTAR